MLKIIVFILMIVNFTTALHDFNLKECDLKNFKRDQESSKEFKFKSCILPLNNISR